MHLNLAGVTVRHIHRYVGSPVFLTVFTRVVFDHVCTTGTESYGGIAIVSHPDWSFSKRLNVGESSLIFKGELHRVVTILNVNLM